MLTVHSESHRLRNARTELYGGELVPPFECPARVDTILASVKDVGLGEVMAPKDYGMQPIFRVHDREYLDFLAQCWRQWQAAGFKGEAIATSWPARGMVQRCPDHIDGQIGYYSLAGETSICEGTWEAALVSANVALTAQAIVAEGERGAFALCRPPGHHAATDLFGGYCFINNAAVAAQAFLDQGATRIALLDVDFHHGNGTQAIFYDRADVMYLSLHGEPQQAFPYFLGYEDETGVGEGVGFTANYPMPPNTTYARWGDALNEACNRISRYVPDALVVSLGVDTFKHDPISFFKLESEDYTSYGRLLARLKLPTLFVMEGGYAVDEIGINTTNVLIGFENG